VKHVEAGLVSPVVLEPAGLRAEDRFQTLANVAPIGIFEADPSGCCTFMNPVWEAVCQQPVVNALGFGWLDVVHADDRDWLSQPVAPKADPAEPIDQEFRIVRPNGEVRLLHIRLGSVRGADGGHVGWSGSFEDITDVRRDADALRISTQQQEVVAALGLLALGGTSLPVLLEEAVARASDALGAARVETLAPGDVGRDGDPAIRASIDDPRAQIAAIAATPAVGAVFGPREEHFLQSIANVLTAFLHRERLDARSKRRERWLRAYFERSPDMVLRLDSEARILDANPAAERAIGAPAASLRGQSSRCLGLSDQALGTWCIAIGQVHRSQQDQSVEVGLQTAQGARTFAARLTAVADELGAVEFVGAILRDTTEHAFVEQELKQLRRELLDRDERLQALIGSLIGERAVLRDRAREWGIAALTPRERTILRLLASGQTNREIAAQLGLSPGTVKNRIGLLLPKLGAADRTQAVAIALQLGLLTGDAEAPLPHFNLGDFE